MGKRTAESKVRTTPEKWEESRIELNLSLFKRLPYKVVNHPWKGVFKSGSNACISGFCRRDSCTQRHRFLCPLGHSHIRKPILTDRSPASFYSPPVFWVLFCYETCLDW